MDDEARFQRLVGISAILVGLLQAVNSFLVFASVKYNVEALTTPALLLSAGHPNPQLFRWSMILDMFAYLVFAPVAVLSWRWFKSRGSALVTIYALSGLAYSLVGSIGAATLGAVVPSLIADYALAPELQRQSIGMLAGTFYQAVTRGLWNPLEILLMGIWFLGIGSLLRRERPGLGIIGIVTGGFAMLDVLGWILDVELIFNIGVGGLSLLIVWSIWFGIDLLRKPIVTKE